MIFACFEFSSVQANILYVFLLRIKCRFTKQIKTNRELRNAATFASVLIYITTALPVGRLARETTPVSPLKHCVTFETPCQICTSFSDEQLQKIQNRKRYLKKQKAATSSKDDELDLLGEGDGDSDGDSFQCRPRVCC